MLNRFTALPKATIQKTQSLVDLGVIDTAIQRQQKAYDTQAATIAQANKEANNLPVYGKHATKLKEQLVGDLQTKTAEWSNVDLADPRYKQEVNSKLNEWASDPELNKHLKIGAIKSEFDTQTKKLMSENKLNDSQRLLRELEWQKYSETGEAGESLGMPLYEAKNLIEGRAELVKNIKDSGSSGMGFIDNIAYKTSSKGVNIKTLDKAVQDQLFTYMNSPYGKQERDDYKVLQMQGAIPKSMTFENYLFKQIKSTTDTFAHMTTDSDKASAYNAKTKKDEDTKTIPLESVGKEFSPEAAKARFNTNGNFKRIKGNWFDSTMFDGLEIGDSEKPKSEYTPYEKEVDRIREANKAKGINLTHEQISRQQAVYKPFKYDAYMAGQGEKPSKLLEHIASSAPIMNGAEKSTLSDILKSKNIDLNKLTPNERKEALSQYQIVGEVRPTPNGLVTGYTVSSPDGELILDISKQVIENALRSSNPKDRQKAADALNAEVKHKLSLGRTASTLMQNADGEYREVTLIPNFADPKNPHIEFD
jgi:hypothetical protein